ncbi:unnamed protein product [Meganyctiphanes norvegica]|uniref:Uncharacterized protein n=1 Tax=Meganyctiphanes norvegica TaxID=48144 RepID=A0AAV2RRC3_MEGNR
MKSWLVVLVILSSILCSILAQSCDLELQAMSKRQSDQVLAEHIDRAKLIKKVPKPLIHTLGLDFSKIGRRKRMESFIPAEVFVELYADNDNNYDDFRAPFTF